MGSTPTIQHHQRVARPGPRPPGMSDVFRSVPTGPQTRLSGGILSSAAGAPGGGRVL